MQYFIHHQGEQKGPWSFEQIAKALEQSDIAWTDYIFDSELQDWVMLLEFQPLSPKLKAYFDSPKKTKINAAPEPQMKSVEHTVVQVSKPELVYKGQTEVEWYVLRGQDKYGPFAYLELVKMLQDKKLFEYEFVWSKELSQWQKVADLAEFSAEKIKKLYDSGELEGLEVFFRRKHKRVNLGSSILVHDEKKLYKAQTAEISAGGCGIILNSGSLEVGQRLFLHFKASDEVPPFNAKVEVVSRRKFKGLQNKYGLKFLEISPQVQKAIKDFSLKVAS